MALVLMSHGVSSADTRSRLVLVNPFPLLTLLCVRQDCWNGLIRVVSAQGPRFIQRDDVDDHPEEHQHHSQPQSPVFVILSRRTVVITMVMTIMFMLIVGHR